MSAGPPWLERRLHFVGVGGSGMSGLALLSSGLGAVVTGSDVRQTATTDRLGHDGIAVIIGHHPGNVPDGAEVVHSSAVPAHNVERRRAAELGLRQLGRGELLGELTRLKRCIAVAGSHGKTTTTSMIVHALRGAGVTPSHYIGGTMRDGTPSAAWHEGRWLVVETDESDRSFLSVRPDIAVVTNVEPEHMDEYRSYEELRRAFSAFVAGAGAAVVPERPHLDGHGQGPASAERHDRQDSPERPWRTVLRPGAVLGPSGSRFEWQGHTVLLPLLGAHNAANAAAALEACALAGADPAAAVQALGDFPGVHHRLELVGSTPAGNPVYNDCAIHPNAVRADFAALRSAGWGRVVAVFEPLRYSRTAELADDVGAALAEADAAVIMDVYPGSEAHRDVPVVSGRVLADAARAHAEGRPVVFAATAAAAIDAVVVHLRPGDACIVMGIGPQSAALTRGLVARS